MGILGVLTKNSLNLNLFPPIPPNFEGNKNLRFWGKKGGMSVPSQLFYFLTLKLPNKRTNLPFILLKLPKKRREEYYKNIHFILFYSLLPNKTLSHLSYDCWVATLMFKIFRFSNKTKPSSKCCIPKNKNIVSRPSAF